MSDGSLRLCVLASGSRGNASVVEVRSGDGPRQVLLIDLGLSPRRLQQSLHARGISLSEVRCALITHFDRDHFHTAWASRDLPFPLLVREEHETWAFQCGADARTIRTFAGSVQPVPGVRVSSSLEFHDEMGVCALRLDTRSGDSMAYCTDLGSITSDLVDLCHEVRVLAIESNYCPRMQEASARPAFLKRRIMGPAGHLSNEQAARACDLIEPRDHVVLLHLSQDCNRPALARAAHEGRPYRVTVSSQHEPTDWISPRTNTHVPA